MDDSALNHPRNLNPRNRENTQQRQQPTRQQQIQQQQQLDQQQQQQQLDQQQAQSQNENSDPHEFFDKYTNEKKKQADMASLPDYLLKYLEIESKLTSGLLSKSEMQGIMLLLIDLSYSAMGSEDWQAAAKILSKMEQTCDVIINHGDEVDPKIVLFILHNNGVCFQRLGEFHDCIAFLDGCLYNVNRYTGSNEQLKGEIDYLLLKKTEYSINIQIKISYLLSKHKKDHKESYKMISNAIENIHQNFNELLKITKSIHIPSQHHDVDIKLFSSDKTDKFIIESNVERKVENLKQIVSTLEAITSYFYVKDEINESKASTLTTGTQMQNEKYGKPWNVLRSVLGVSQRRSWMIDLKIEDMFRLDPIMPDEFVLNSDPGNYISVDSVYEKILILAVIYYMTSTEQRYLCQAKNLNESLVCYMLHKKSYDICKDFLPIDCPIVSKIIASFELYYPQKKKLVIECELFSDEPLKIPSTAKKIRTLSPNSKEETIRMKRLTSPETDRNRRKDTEKESFVNRLYYKSKKNIINNNPSLPRNLSRNNSNTQLYVRKSAKGSFVDVDSKAETRPTTGNSQKGFSSFLERLENNKPKIRDEDKQKLREANVSKKERVLSPYSDKKRNSKTYGVKSDNYNVYMSNMNYRFKSYDQMKKVRGVNPKTINKSPNKDEVTPIKLIED